MVGNQLVFDPGTAFDHLAVGASEMVTLSLHDAGRARGELDSTVTVTITGSNDGPVAVADVAWG